MRSARVTCSWLISPANTAFLTGTELEHAHAIVHELTALIRERLAPPMRFVKLEGDAVFCYTDRSTFRDTDGSSS